MTVTGEGHPQNCGAVEEAVGEVVDPAADLLGPAARRPQVAFVTEGSYPCSGGGVSVWCDQLMSQLASRRLPPDRDHAHQPGPLGVGAARQHGDGEPLRFVGPRPRPGGPRRARTVPDRVARPDPIPRVAPAGRLRRGASSRSPKSSSRCWSWPPTDRSAGSFVSRPSATRWSSRSSIPSTSTRSTRCSLADGLEIAGVMAHLLTPLTIDPGPVDIVHATANGLPALVCLSAQARRNTPFMLTEHGLYLRSDTSRRSPSWAARC